MLHSRLASFGLHRTKWAKASLCRLGGLLLGAALVAGGAQAESRPVVLVELFTSQGCSSGPPAEAVLLDLAQDPDVLALAFHVDYWDRLGWKDPYSSRAATQRQYGYAGLFGSSTVYTPQIVVDGRAEMVGSRRAEVLAAVEAAQAQPAAAIPLEARIEDGALSIQIGAGQGSARLLLLGFDPRIATAVRRGENAGRTIEQANVVRAVEPIAQWEGAALALTHPLPLGERTALVLQAPDGTILATALVEE